MKKIYYFVALSLLASSCDDKIGEKIVSRQDITLKVFYESPSSTQVSDGILLRFQKSYTNGDTTQCEVFSKRETIVTKIDCNGNKIWERINIANGYLPNSFLEDKSGFLWAYNGGNQLLKFDKLLNLVGEINFDFSQFIKTGNSYVNSVVMGRTGKIIGLGATFINKDNYKPFICEIGERGVEKVQDIGDSHTDATRAAFAEMPDGKWFVVQYTQDYPKMITTLNLKSYDKTYQPLKSEQVVHKTTSFYANSFVFHQSKLFMLVREVNENKMISYDIDFNKTEAKFMTNDDSLSFLPSLTNLWVYDYAKNIYQVNQQTLESKKYLDLSVPFLSSVGAVDSAGITSFVGLGQMNQAKSSIVFNRISLNSKLTKQLYKSEYPRKCNRYE